MTKRKLLVSSAMVVSALLILNYVGTFRLCGGEGYGSCMDSAYDILILFVPFLPPFILSLITYFMREEIFQSWWKFARIATLVSIFLIFLAPSYSSDWMFPIEKGNVAFFTSLIFIFVSAIIIIRAHRKNR